LAPSPDSRSASPFWQAPAFKWALAAALAAVAAGLGVAGWLTEVATWLVAAAAVLAVLVVVEGAIAAQAHFWARRRRQAEAWHTVEERVEALLPELKADYWRGNHYGRHGLESSWRWRNAVADRAASLWARLPEAARVFSLEEVREALARRTQEAVAAEGSARAAEPSSDGARSSRAGGRSSIPVASSSSATGWSRSSSSSARWRAW